MAEFLEPLMAHLGAVLAGGGPEAQVNREADCLITTAFMALWQRRRWRSSWSR